MRALAALRRPALDPAVIAFSRTGDWGLLWVAAGAVEAVALRRPRLALEVAGATWGALTVNAAVKRIVRRARPPVDGPLPHLIDAPTSPSFPSAHAAMSAAAGCTLAAAAPALAPLVAAAVAVMAASRVYLGVHYASDVAAGLALGAVVGGTAVLATR